MQRKILFGIPPKNHINLAMDELHGLEALGYECETSTYSRNNPSLNKLNKLLGVLKNAFVLVRKLYKFNPDILYLNSRFGRDGCTRDFITIVVIRLMYYRKVLISVKTHGSDLAILTKNSLFLNKIVLPYLSNNIDVWFFLSQDEKTEIGKFFPKLGQKAHVTSNIIDPNRSVTSKSFLENYGLSDNRFKFFFAGRMIKEKGIFSIVKAIPLYKYKEKSIFVMSGEGDDFNELKATIDELNLKPFVELTGFVPEEVCDHFYANTDALVFPTYFDEGFPMALFKSIANGLPVITTKIRAAKDYLKEPENCLWVDGKSEQSVAEALNKLYEDQQLQENMSANNKRLGQKFTRKAVCLEMHQVFVTLH